MISRYVVLGTLVLLAFLIVVSAVAVHILDAVKGWRDKKAPRGRSGKE